MSVSIEEAVQSLFTPELIQRILNETDENVSPYVRICNFINKVRLLVYGDDFTTTNPLAPLSSKTNKVLGLYIDIANRLSFDSADTESIPVVFLAYREEVKKASMERYLLAFKHELEQFLKV